MKNKLYFFVPFLVLVLIFGFSSCKIKSLPEDLEKIDSLEEELEGKNQVIRELEKELSETKEILKEAQSQATEMIVEEQKEESPTTVEEVEESFREEVRKLIEEDFKGKLTKLTWNEDFSEVYLAYNTRWAVEETIQKEVYDITLLFAPNNPYMNLDITATSDRGRIVHAYTSSEIMTKIKNLEISYSEWLGEAF